MNTAIAVTERARSLAWPRIWDYLELTKPRIATMVVVTVVLAALIANWGQSELWPVLGAVLGTTLVAASASALNQLLERDSDARMIRTANRPIPAGRLQTLEVIIFSAILLVVGVVVLLLMTTPLTTAFALATWGLYVLVYTPLKKRTAWNTAIGAIPGAMPIWIGWTAQGNSLDLRAVAVFLLVFLWQFPHFMAIAWRYRNDYACGGLRMSTVDDPSGLRAGVQAILGAMAMLPVSMIPVMVGPRSTVYAACVFCLGVSYLGCAIAFALNRNDLNAQRLLRASLIYLPSTLVLICSIPWMP